MAPPSLNPQSMGNGQPQQSLPNMGSPFAQNPTQQTNPFMGGGNANNASKSPFEGAGFNNPFGGEHGASGNPFGGGSSGGGVKGLIESNNKLIQAINKLTGIFEKMTQKMGGGMGNMGGMGGMIGGGAGMMGGTDPLQAAQMRRLAAGGIGGPMAFQNSQLTGAGFQQNQNVMSNVQGGIHDAASRLTNGLPVNDYNAAYQAYNQQTGRMYEMGRTNQPLPQDLNNLDPHEQQLFRQAHAQGQLQYDAQQNMIQNTRNSVLNNIPGVGTARDFLGMNLPQGSTFGTRAMNAGGMLARGGMQAAGASVNLGLNIGAAQDVSGMLSQIPYIGGLLAAPMVALQSRINQSAGLESLSRLVAQQGGIGQTGNLYQTHQNMIAGFQALGLDPAAALNEALQMQEAAGRFDQVDPNSIMGNPLAAYVGAGFTGSTIGAFKRLDRKDKMISFDPYKVFGYGLSMELGDQGMMELQGAFEGLQQMVPGMGLRGNADVLMGQVGRNVAGGFIGTQAVAQAQRQVQGTVEMGGGLKGIFGGLAETLTMASFLGEYGDPVKAIRAFESGYAANPTALKGRLTKQFGKGITEMAYLSKFTSADYDNIGSAGLPEGSIPSTMAGDIVLSKETIGSQISRGNDLYNSQVANAKELIRLNDKLEKALVDGIVIKDMSDLTDAMIELAKTARAAASTLTPYATQLIKFIDDVANGRWPF